MVEIMRPKKFSGICLKTNSRSNQTFHQENMELDRIESRKNHINYCNNHPYIDRNRNLATMVACRKMAYTRGIHIIKYVKNRIAMVKVSSRGLIIVRTIWKII
jgi:hypothetical protein